MDAKELARAVIDAHAGALIDLSRRVHELAETAYEETRSAAAVAGALEALDFDITRDVAELPTAFVARFGSGALNIGICAEYDALPGLGHACGHNIIAATAVGAAAGIAAVADELDMTVTVLGTPAEESGGGKIEMLKKGAFDGLHAAMMVHPEPVERDSMRSLAVDQLHVVFRGRPAHAAAAPERGINAASAMALAQAGIGMLREHMVDSDRVHGIVIEGGDAPNIVPARTTGRWFVRAATLGRLAEVERRVFDVFRGAALMTGCSLEIRRTAPNYSEIVAHPGMAAKWRDNMQALGRDSRPVGPDDLPASTDMGNVSYAMPAIHPLIALDARGAVNHERAFAASAGAPSADTVIVDGSIGMAWTAIDMATDDALRAELLARPYSVSEVPPDNALYLGYDFDETIRFDPESLR